MYWHIPAIQLGKRVMRNTNSMLGRYEGADGMKTGFICASGFNLVATATRRGRKLIAVVLGSPSSPVRAVKTASLLERGFNSNVLGWLTPSLGSVESLAPIDAAPPDLRDEMCGKHRKRPAAEEADDEPTSAAGGPVDASSPQAFMLTSLGPAPTKPSELLGPVAAVHPILVHVGPAKKSAEAQFAANRTKPNDKNKNAKNTKNAPAAAPAQVAAKPSQVAAATAAAKPAPAATGQATSVNGYRAAVPQDAFGPPPGQFTQSQPRALPAVSDSGNPAWMSFAPAARAETAPLTAAPAQQAKLVSVPMPRPKPKLAAGKH
jgi:D-alanyl-D-alanine carboxypeptidase